MTEEEEGEDEDDDILLSAVILLLSGEEEEEEVWEEEDNDGAIIACDDRNGGKQRRWRAERFGRWNDASEGRVDSDGDEEVEEEEEDDDDDDDELLSFVSVCFDSAFVSIRLNAIRCLFRFNDRNAGVSSARGAVNSAARNSAGVVVFVTVFALFTFLLKFESDGDTNDNTMTDNRVINIIIILFIFSRFSK